MTQVYYHEDYDGERSYFSRAPNAIASAQAKANDLGYPVDVMCMDIIISTENMVTALDGGDLHIRAKAELYKEVKPK